MRDLISGLILDTARQLHAQQIGRLFTGRIDRPIQLLVANDETVDSVERLQNVFARTQTQCPQENRPQKLAFPIDPDIEDILLVVLELHPRSAVGNDLA